jgi:hypothetical protein
MVNVYPKRRRRKGMPQAESQLNSSVYYFYGKHTSLPHPSGKAGKSASGYHYRCYRGDGDSLLFSSHNYRSGQVGKLFFTDREESRPDYLLKMRPSFPLTGKIDLLEAQSKALQGVVTRGRKFFDGNEKLLGEFKDTRTWKDHLGESAVDAIGNLIFGGADNASADSQSGGTRFVLLCQNRPIGSLVREQLPFFPDPPTRTERGAVGKALRKILPENIGKALIDITPPVGWRLEVRDPVDVTHPILLLCAALMVIELSRW